MADNLSGAITGAHLHTGASGMSGPVAVDLTASINGNTVMATIDPSTILADLNAGNIYINLHTAANPGGEIRGQLVMDDKIPFDALLNGAQEVPAVTTTAMGLASIKLNTTLDTLWYDVVVNGLAAQASAAHFHNGIVGVAGSVVYNISADINGNRITGMATGANISPLLSELFKGNLYLNIHNSINPNGEIRGQVYRLLREGYIGVIEGSQEVPPVASAARGTLVASVDRNQTDLHFMVVADNITANGVHFHNGPEGQNGPVIFNVTPFFMNNGAFGYWKSTDSSPFTTANSLMFRNDSVYVNLHTTANPNGEIRGQAERGYHCFTLTSALQENNVHYQNVSLYPNPVVKDLTLAFTATVDRSAELIIADMTGRKLYGNTISISSGENKMSLDVNNLAKGIYLLSIQTADNTSIISKFIKD